MDKKSKLKITGLLVCLIAVFIAIISSEAHKIGICNPYNYKCVDFFQTITVILLPSFLFLPVAVITVWMKEEVFRAWWKVALYSAPLIVITMLWARRSVEYSSNFGNQLVYVIPGIIAIIALGMMFSRSLKTWFLIYKNKQIKPWTPTLVFFGILAAIYSVMLIITFITG